MQYTLGYKNILGLGGGTAMLSTVSELRTVAPEPLAGLRRFKRTYHFGGLFSTWPQRNL